MTRTPDRLPEGAEKRREVEVMFDRIATRYDRVNRVMSLGLDRGWRRAAVGTLDLPRGSRVLDVACGTGDLCDELRTAGHFAIGIDLSGGMLAAAHTAAPLVRADALRLPVPDASVDGLISGFALRNVVDLGAYFSECARVLRPGGRTAALETAEPTNPLLRAGHRIWFRTLVPAIAGRISGERAAYRYLPRSASYLPSTDDLLRMVRECGFDRVERRTFTGGAVQLITGTRG